MLLIGFVGSHQNWLILHFYTHDDACVEYVYAPDIGEFISLCYFDFGVVDKYLLSLFQKAGTDKSVI